MSIWKQLPKLAAAFGLALVLAGCGVNTIPTKDQTVKAKWADVQAAYQRRADLIPNLANTVAAYAKQEQTVLTQVTQARASATQVKVDVSTISDPALNVMSALMLLGRLEVLTVLVLLVPVFWRD